MLKPFKSFLTYLAKNSRQKMDSRIHTRNADDEVEEEDEAEEDPRQPELLLEQEEDSALITGASTDPLFDPLAIDHDYSIAGHAADDVDSVLETLQGTENDEYGQDESDARIVFVDINSVLEGSRPTTPPEPPKTITPRCCSPGTLNRPTEIVPLTPKPPPPAQPKLSSTVATANTSSLEDGESRSDGSDSGLGSELLGLANKSAKDPITAPDHPIPVRKSALKRPSMDNVDDECVAATKRQRRSVRFENVTVFYFPRMQGFVCVPSQGGCTLGMEATHVAERTMTLAEHLIEQRKRALSRQSLLLNPLRLQQLGSAGLPITTTTSSDESEDDFSEEVAVLGSGDGGSGAGLDLDTDSTTGFLQPVSTKQRRALLKAAGVRKIEAFEKNECRVIRTSREVCGCSCQGYCDPESCSCSLSGIKCQVDRVSFPCGCAAREQCGNVKGRVEFNQVRVQTHFIHTIMRLELEKKQAQVEQVDAALGSAAAAVSYNPAGLLPGTDADSTESSSRMNINNNNIYNNHHHHHHVGDTDRRGNSIDFHYAYDKHQQHLQHHPNHSHHNHEQPQQPDVVDSGRLNNDVDDNEARRDSLGDQGSSVGDSFNSRNNHNIYNILSVNDSGHVRSSRLGDDSAVSSSHQVHPSSDSNNCIESGPMDENGLEPVVAPKDIDLLSLSPISYVNGSGDGHLLLAPPPPPASLSTLSEYVYGEDESHQNVNINNNNNNCLPFPAVASPQKSATACDARKPGPGRDGEETNSTLNGGLPAAGGHKE